MCNFLRSIRRRMFGEGASTPASSSYTAAPEPPAPEPEVPNVVRKGTVLRRSETVEKRYPRHNPNFPDDVPRIIFAIEFDDEQGKEVQMINQEVTDEASVVGPGDLVVVTFITRALLSRYVPAERAFVNIDWERQPR